MTKTGIGVDADTVPASLDIGYLRHEGVLARVYDDVAVGNNGAEAPRVSRPLVHPVLTTIGADAKGLGLDINHSFATGDAALVFADYLGRPADYPLGEANRVPQPALDGALLVRKGGGTPYFFGTDTTLGLGVTWAGGNLPRSVSIGYKRKELAIVPLDSQEVWLFTPWGMLFSEDQMVDFLKRDIHMDPAAPAPAFHEGPVAGGAGPKSVQTLKDLGLLVAYERSKIPSLIATARAGASATANVSDTGITVAQTFATGAAATLLAKHSAVRAVLGPSLIPNFTQMLLLEGGFQSIADLALSQQMLDNLRTRAKGDPAAQAAIDKVDAIAKEGGFPPFDVYDEPDTTGALKRRGANAPTVATISDALTWLSVLNTSVRCLRAVEQAGGLKAGLKLENWSGGKAVADAQDVKDIRADLAEQAKLSQAIGQRMASDPRLIEAVQIAILKRN